MKMQEGIKGPWPTRPFLVLNSCPLPRRTRWVLGSIWCGVAVGVTLHFLSHSTLGALSIFWILYGLVGGGLFWWWLLDDCSGM